MTETPKQCFNCGKDLEKASPFCPHCNAPLPLHGSLLPMLGDLLLRLISMLLLGALGGFFLLGGVGLINVDMLNKNSSPFEMLAWPFAGVVLCGVGLYFLWCALQLLKNE